MTPNDLTLVLILNSINKLKSTDTERYGHPIEDKIEASTLHTFTDEMAYYTIGSLGQNYKIKAIQIVRQHSLMGLREAKHFVDECVAYYFPTPPAKPNINRWSDTYADSLIKSDVIVDTTNYALEA